MSEETATSNAPAAEVKQTETTEEVAKKATAEAVVENGDSNGHADANGSGNDDAAADAKKEADQEDKKGGAAVADEKPVAEVNGEPKEGASTETDDAKAADEDDEIHKDADVPVKRTIDESKATDAAASAVEPIPVSPEKIAKLKEADETASETVSSS